MTEELKKELLNMLQDISYGFDAYQDGRDECGDEFWARGARCRNTSPKYLA